MILKDCLYVFQSTMVTYAEDRSFVLHTSGDHTFPVSALGDLYNIRNNTAPGKCLFNADAMNNHMRKIARKELTLRIKYLENTTDYISTLGFEGELNIDILLGLIPVSTVGGKYYTDSNSTLREKKLALTCRASTYEIRLDDSVTAAINENILEKINSGKDYQLLKITFRSEKLGNQIC